ncbi:hypothetical protein Cci01nite_80170 [Catellatospora citrea]|uniref:Uncharacterized protein n=1 Tax=Catellatospora citrea TaxID=53366 RepID=A0A8J3KQB1_9ACTN|nr:hypothetical protein Cci01nite_80170 [Catellatospora citrea]
MLIAPASATTGGLTGATGAGDAPPQPASSNTTAHAYTLDLIADLPAAGGDLA